MNKVLVLLLCIIWCHKNICFWTQKNCTKIFERLFPQARAIWEIYGNENWWRKNGGRFKTARKWPQIFFSFVYDFVVRICSFGQNRRLSNILHGQVEKFHNGRTEKKVTSYLSVFFLRYIVFQSHKYHKIPNRSQFLHFY